MSVYPGTSALMTPDEFMRREIETLREQNANLENELQDLAEKHTLACMENVELQTRLGEVLEKLERLEHPEKFRPKHVWTNAPVGSVFTRKIKIKDTKPYVTIIGDCENCGGSLYKGFGDSLYHLEVEDGLQTGGVEICFPGHAELKHMYAKLKTGF